jgi:predicted TIM-barrel fold metal-dependent hydrolase
MDEAAIQRAKERLAAAAEGRVDPSDVQATLQRAREQIEALADLAAQIESALPGQVSEAVREGLQAEVIPVGRHIAEVRGLAGQTIRRLERMEGDLLAERHARLDDLALLVDLITSSWKGVDERLARLEERLEESKGAIVYRIEERRTS